MLQKERLYSLTLHLTSRIFSQEELFHVSLLWIASCGVFRLEGIVGHPVDVLCGAFEDESLIAHFTLNCSIAESVRNWRVAANLGRLPRRKILILSST